MQNFIDNNTDLAAEFNTLLVARRQLASITAKASQGDYLTKYEQNFLTRSEYQAYAELRTSQSRRKYQSLTSCLSLNSSGLNTRSKRNNH